MNAESKLAVHHFRSINAMPIIANFVLHLFCLLNVNIGPNITIGYVLLYSMVSHKRTDRLLMK